MNRRWCAGTWLSVTAAAGWLEFTVLQRLFSGRLWLWLVPDLLPPIAFLAVPVLLLAVPLLARSVRRPLPGAAGRLVAGGALLGLLLGLGYAGLNPSALDPRTPTPAATAAPPDAVRVFAWNTRYWHQNDDPEHFYRYLRAQRADVYLLQEYLNWDERAGLDGARPVDDLNRLRHWFPGWTVVSRGELLTLSRFPVVAAPRVGPDRSLGGTADFPAVFAAAKVLRTDMRIGASVLSAYNVHLPVQVNLALDRRFLDFVRDRDAARRQQLAGLRADLAANGYPVVVAGDFNTSPAMANLDGIRATLRDAASADGSLYPASWPVGRWPALWRLDWAFTTAGVPVHGYRFVDPQGLSDHRAQHLLISVGSRR